MIRSKVSIYVAFSDMYNFTINYSIVMTYDLKNGNKYVKEFCEGVKNTTKARILLYAITQALNALNKPCIVDIFLHRSDNQITKMNNRIQSQSIERLKSTYDLWNKIYKISELHKINFIKVKDNDEYFIKCCKNLDKKIDSTKEDSYEPQNTKRAFLVEKMFKSVLTNSKIQLSQELNFLECIVLNFVFAYNNIYTEYSIAKILCGSTNLRFLSNEVKESVYYGILKKTYSAQEIRCVIYNLIHKKQLLEENFKKYYSTNNDNTSYIAIKLKSDLSEQLKNELQTIGNLILSTLK